MLLCETLHSHIRHNTAGQNIQLKNKKKISNRNTQRTCNQNGLVTMKNGGRIENVCVLVWKEWERRETLVALVQCLRPDSKRNCALWFCDCYVLYTSKILLQHKLVFMCHSKCKSNTCIANRAPAKGHKKKNSSQKQCFLQSLILTDCPLQYFCA